MSRIFVTGGTGYLGGRIVAHLRSLGHQVSAGTRSSQRAQLPGYALTDYENPQSLQAVFEGYDSIVHLAGMNEIEAGKNPELALHTTASYTIRVLHAAHAAGVGKIIYFSTVHVYGSPLSGNLSETSCTRAAHPYAITHRAAEDFVYQAHREGKISGVIFRLSNAFGYSESPDIDRWSLLVNDLCRQLATEGRLTLKSSGLQLRDFIPLSDVCLAVQHALGMPRQDDPYFNLGSGKSQTVLDMAQLIANRYQKACAQAPIMNIPAAKPGEMVSGFSLNVEKLHASGFVPRSMVLEEIDGFITRCMDWRATGLL